MFQYFLIFFNIILISSAQLLLKYGSNSLAVLEPSKSAVSGLANKLLNPFIFFGGVAYVASFVLWLYILSKNKVSFVYPVMSLSYVAVMILSVYFLKEKVNFYQWLGGALIILGTGFIFYKH